MTLSSDDSHETQVVTRELGYHAEHVATCTCGWHGPVRTAHTLAREDAEEHERETAAEDE